MENDTEVIRQQMADTRRALSDKVEAVENLVASAVKETTQTVTETVANVTHTVEDTVHHAADAVSDTVDSVKEALDLSACVENHPWMAMAGSVALGYTLGYLLGPAESYPSRQAWTAPTPPAPPEAPQTSSNLGSFLPAAWQPVIDRLKGLAVGTAGGLLGEMLLNAVPESMKQEVSRMIDDTTEAMGGTLLRREQHEGNGHAR